MMMIIRVMNDDAGTNTTMMIEFGLRDKVCLFIFIKILIIHSKKSMIIHSRKCSLNKIPNRTMTDTNTRMMIKFGLRDNVCLAPGYHRNVLIPGYSNIQLGK